MGFVVSFVFKFSFIGLHSPLGFFAYLSTSALTYYFFLPLLEWGYLFMTW